MIIRNETNADIAAVNDVTIAAFKNHPISEQTEQFIVSALRNTQALCLSLVAEVDGRVAGHIAFSPVTISDGTPDWYGIGPVSVLPELQRQGIGKALIREGLSVMKARGAAGCALVGNPEYYKRFGFRNVPDLIYEGIPQEFFLVLTFHESMPQGHVVFHSAFQATS